MSEITDKQRGFGCLFVAIIFIVSFFLVSKCLDSADSKEDVLSIKDKKEYFCDSIVDVIIKQNIKSKNICDKDQFKSIIINNAIGYVNMEFKYVDNNISKEAIEKYPNDYWGQDEYCKDKKVPIMQDNIVEEYIQYLPNIVSSKIDSLYQNVK